METNGKCRVLRDIFSALVYLATYFFFPLSKGMAVVLDSYVNMHGKALLARWVGM